MTVGTGVIHGWCDSNLWPVGRLVAVPFISTWGHLFLTLVLALFCFGLVKLLWLPSETEWRKELGPKELAKEMVRNVSRTFFGLGLL